MNRNSALSAVVEGSGKGVVAHVGLHAPGAFADRLGLGDSLSARIPIAGERLPLHDRGKVLVQAMLMLTGGGEACADIEHLRSQGALFRSVASDSTLYRTFRSIGPVTLAKLWGAMAEVRASVWRRATATTGMAAVVLDIDASLHQVHSENKEQAAANCKGGYGFHPMYCFADATGETLAVTLRPGNAGANNIADHVALLDAAIAGLPEEIARGHRRCDDAGLVARAIQVRTDSAGCTDFVWHARARNVGFAVGARSNANIHAALSRVAYDSTTWQPALRQDGDERPGAAVAELTDHLDLSAWPSGTRLIVPRALVPTALPHRGSRHRRAQDAALAALANTGPHRPTGPAAGRAHPRRLAGYLGVARGLRAHRPARLSATPPLCPPPCSRHASRNGLGPPTALEMAIASTRSKPECQLSRPSSVGQDDRARLRSSHERSGSMPRPLRATACVIEVGRHPPHPAPPSIPCRLDGGSVGEDTKTELRPAAEATARTGVAGIVVPTHNDGANIGPLLARLLDDPDVGQIVVVASGCDDSTIATVTRLSADHPETLRLYVERERSGKVSAVNFGLAQLTTPVMVVVSGDVLPERGAIAKVVAAVQEPGVGLAGGRPVPVNPSDTAIGHAAHLLWRLHHRLALHQPKLGEMIALRAEAVVSLPRTSVDEACFQALLEGAGWRSVYVPDAVVWNRGPGTTADFIAQRRQIHTGHLWLKRRQHYAVPSLRLGLLGEELWNDIRTEPKGTRPRQLAWTAATVGMEAWARLLARLDYLQGKENHVWAMVESTKAPATDTHGMGVRHS